MPGGAATEYPIQNLTSPDLVPGRAAAGLFDGGAEIGQLMQSVDWAGRQLVPSKTGRRVLRLPLAFCSGSGWQCSSSGSRACGSLDNDAYRPILGTTKHPAALGQRGADCWLEIWDIILPMLEAVHRGTHGGRGRAAGHRPDGYLEEGYYTYTQATAHSVETGAIGGVFCGVYDTTDRVIGERRLRTLRGFASHEIARDAGTRHAGWRQRRWRKTVMTFRSARSIFFRRQPEQARLAGVTGVEPGSPANPPLISFEGAGLSGNRRRGANDVGGIHSGSGAAYRPLPGGLACRG